jgi:Holliday junction resolvase RusA-like endonuclease
MVSFTVHGQPVAKGRARVTIRKGRVRAYTPEKTVNYEALVADAGKIAMLGRKPLDGALLMTLRIYMQIPLSWSKKKKLSALNGEIYPTKKPDSSNILKAGEDALNGIVYRDDSQIVEHDVSKRYSDKPRIEIAFEVIGEEA